MSLASPYQEHYYIADGETTSFSFGEYFTAPASANVKCIVYFDNGTSSVPTFTVDIVTGFINITALTTPDGQVLNAPPAGSSVRVFRDTPEQQNVTASQLQNYTAKQLEKVFDSIVAMIQEVSYSDKHKTLRLTETQRDVFLAFLKEANDDALLYWDNEARTIVPTDFVRQDVVRMSGGLFFRMKHDAELRPYLEWSINGQTDWNSLNLWTPVDTANEAKEIAEEALDLAQTVQGDFSSHKLNHNNPHETSLSNLTDTDFTNLQTNQFLQFNGTKWVNVYSSAVASWGTIIGNITDQTDLMNKFTEYVRTDGTSVMTAPLLMRATDDFKCAIAPYWDGVGFFKLNNNNSVTLIATLEYQDSFAPAENNVYNIGSTSKKWKNLYLAGKAYMSVINNGYDIAVPVTNSADTFALKSEVDLAANSGRMITDQGLWYAKMYAATVVPSADDDTNYADFSQTDGQGNPIIVTYNRVNGAWVQDQTITPPADYDGYVSITSKIWDITEQAGQQGGRILWNHQSKEFTPYPQIISFENAALTGTPTAPTLNASSPSDQIVNKQTLENALVNHGTGRNVGDVFFTMRNDSELNGAVECDGATYNTTDFTGAQSIGSLLAAGKLPYLSLADYATALATDGSVGVFGWDGGNTTEFRVPSLNDIFVETGTAAQLGDFVPAGLPDHYHNVRYRRNDNSGYHAEGSVSPHIYTGSNLKGSYPSLNASESNSIYGNSNTVQPKSVRYRAMVQLATSASDEAVETCTGVLADVAALKYDYVVDFQAPTSANNYTWYRKYKSGWVEQGGRIETNTTSVTMPVEMSDSDYQAIITWRKTSGNTNTPTFQNIGSLTQTTTDFTVATAQTFSRNWYIMGMAAS